MPIFGIFPSPEVFVTDSLKNNSVNQHLLESTARKGMVLALVELSIHEERQHAATEVQNKIQKYYIRASLVVQCLRIHLPMQGTRVRDLVREDPTCHGAARPVSHNY